MRMPTDTRKKDGRYSSYITGKKAQGPYFLPLFVSLTHTHTYSLECVALFTAGGERDHMGRSWC